MPFTKQSDRVSALRGVISKVGDLCFLEYRSLKQEWDQERRWTIAHAQYTKVFNVGNDKQAAKELAWWVHFVLNIIPYELEKREEHGDVHSNE